MVDVEHEITELLQAWRDGDETALEKLTPRVYRELHKAATRCMRSERANHTLQTTALINELYLRLTALQGIDWQNRAHFFAVCARQMRRILTDQARAATRRSAVAGHRRSHWMRRPMFHRNPGPSCWRLMMHLPPWPTLTCARVRWSNSGFSAGFDSGT
jgi:RNA polymerase sigma factor (TIGR02999 family)